MEMKKHWKSVSLLLLFPFPCLCLATLVFYEYKLCYSLEFYSYFLAAPMVCGRSQARDQTRATAMTQATG